jgi:putative alpha-1,2-mannosidase
MIRVIIFYVIQFIYCNACPIKYVNPFIGTTGVGFGSGQMSPAAQLPFGALKLGPDTTTGVVNIPFRHCSGYNYYDNQIRSFSHTHLQGAGIADLGNFGIMPFSFNSLNDNNVREKNSWYSLFDKNSEKASPGFYEVDLINEKNNSKINVNLLAVSRFAGVHAYEWKNTDTHFPGVIIDLCHAAAENLSCKNPMVSFNEKNNEFNASLEFHGGLSGAGFEIFMTGKIIGGPVSERVSCLDKSCNQSSQEDHIESDTGVLYNRLRFLPTTKKLRIEVALSFVSIDQALINYNDVFDLPLNSDGIEWLVNFGWRNRTEFAWCEVLSKMKIEAPDSYNKDQKNELLMLTYTSYYRVLSSPTMYSEIGGAYMGLDKKVHNSHEERKSL